MPVKYFLNKLLVVHLPELRLLLSLKRRGMNKNVFVLMLAAVFAVGTASAQRPREEDPEPKTGFDKSKLFIGGNFGLSFSNYYSLVNVSPQIGYRFNDYLAVGTGVNFIYSSQKYFDNFGNDAFRYNYGVTG